MAKSQVHLIVLFLLTINFLNACGTTDSDNVKTKGIHASIHIKSQNGKTAVTTYLSVGSGGLTTELNLTHGDTLTATINGVTQTLAKQKDIFGSICYRTVFGYDSPGTDIIVALNRENDVSAPYSHVNLPETLLITSPSIGQIVSAAEAMPLNWEPYGISNSIELKTTTRCKSLSGLNIVMTQWDTIADSGHANITLRNLQSNPSIDMTQSCSLEIELKRTLFGILDSNYGEGGSIKASRINSTIVSLTI